MQISTEIAQRRLTITWGIGALLLFSVMFLQTVFGHYGERVQDAWEWFLPTIMPTLSLIIGVWVTDIQSRRVKSKTTNKFLYHLSLTLSIVYLLMITLILFLQPIASIPPLELMKQFSLGLTAVQSLATASLGAFFVKSK